MRESSREPKTTRVYEPAPPSGLQLPELGSTERSSIGRRPTGNPPEHLSPTRSPPPRASRFFVALRPDRAAATRLEKIGTALAERCRGKPLAAADLHVTLAFIGERPAAQAESLAALLAGLPQRLPGFQLDEIGRFGPALLWAAPSIPPDWLVDIATAVRDRLDAAGVDFDRRALRPHLTLVRNARERGLVKAAAGPAAQVVQVAGWQLALGGTHESASPQQRYRWHPLPGEAPGAAG